MPVAYDPFDEIRREASGASLIPPQVVADNAAKAIRARRHNRQNWRLRTISVALP